MYICFQRTPPPLPSPLPPPKFPMLYLCGSLKGVDFDIGMWGEGRPVKDVKKLI